MANTPQRNLAVFIDFENLALGFGKSRGLAFDVAKVLDRLLDKGKVITKVAYADWSRFRKYAQPMHEAAIELIEIPKRAVTGKNSADIRLCVDAMDLSYSKEHIDTFVIVSGDSDFSPLVSKLKENGKYVIGLGMRESTSQLLSNNCDEFIFYEDLDKAKADLSSGVTQEKKTVFQPLIESVRALQREGYDVLHSSLVKDTIKRKRPSFDESAYGYRSFSELLEDAELAKLIVLEEDPRSGTYVIKSVRRSRRRR